MTPRVTGKWVLRWFDCRADCRATVARQSMRHVGLELSTLRSGSMLVHKVLFINRLRKRSPNRCRNGRVWHEDCQTMS